MTHLKDMPPPMADLGQRYRRMGQRVREYQVFSAAVELGLFDYLVTPCSPKQLAKLAGTHAGLTEKLLNVLCALGFLVKTGPEYCNTRETTAFLTRDGMVFSDGSFAWIEENNRKFSGLADYLTRGPEPREKKSYTYKPATIRTMAQTCLLGRLQEIVGTVTSLPGFDRARRMMDLGGAHGLFAVAMCQENPDLSAVVFDQPSVTPVTAEYIAAHNMQDRMTTMEGDHTADAFGRGFDLIFESFTFFGSKAGLTDYFTRIREALAPGGLVVSVRSVLDDDRQGPLPQLLWDLADALDGGEDNHHTRAELFDVLEEAGFTEMQLAEPSQPAAGDYRMITARKPDAARIR